MKKENKYKFSVGQVVNVFGLFDATITEIAEQYGHAVYGFVDNNGVSWSVFECNLKEATSKQNFIRKVMQ